MERELLPPLSLLNGVFNGNGSEDLSDEAVWSNGSEVTNASNECLYNRVPSIHEYISAVEVPGLALLAVAGGATLFTLLLYSDALSNVLTRAPRLTKAPSTIILSVYPVVALATYCAMMVPRAQLVSEALSQAMFMTSLYQFFCLIVAYCGGEGGLIDKVQPNSLNTRVGPCCCWPCCCCLPQPPLGKKQLMMLRLLLLQLPIIQGIIYIAELVMWAEEESLYQDNYPYFQPLIAVSILFGLWGIIMTMVATRDTLKGYYIKSKFVVLQLVLVLTKFQGVVLRVAVAYRFLPCFPPFTPAVYGNMIYNSLIIGEMAILMVVARLLYRKRLPHLDIHGKENMLYSSIHALPSPTTIAAHKLENE